MRYIIYKSTFYLITYTYFSGPRQSVGVEIPSFFPPTVFTFMKDLRGRPSGLFQSTHVEEVQVLYLVPVLSSLRITH